MSFGPIPPMTPRYRDGLTWLIYSSVFIAWPLAIWKLVDLVGGFI